MEGQHAEFLTIQLARIERAFNGSKRLTITCSRFFTYVVTRAGNLSELDE